MLWGWLKKNKNEVDSRVGYEETEQRTPKAGYILLFFMFIAALFFGWRAIDDLQGVPQKPEALSHCAAGFLSYGWEDWGRYNHPNYPVYEARYPEPKSLIGVPEFQEPACVFSALEVKHGVPPVYETIKTEERELRNVELELQKVYINISDLERQYNLGLQEKIAEEQRRLYPIPEIQRQLEESRKNRSELETQRDLLRSELKPLDDQLKTLYRKVMQDYRFSWRWYEFKVFLLELLFVIPFFLFVFYGYRRLLAQNSPYTIIFTALIGVASVLLLRILLTWFWSLFLARLIETLWNFIQSFALLKSLVFYGGMMLSIVLFGGAVYLLQKKIFDPRRVAIRRLRQKQCPACQTSLDLALDFCPNCGRKLKEKCTNCGKERWADLTFCPHCQLKKS